MIIVMKTFWTAVKNKIIKITKNICPRMPTDQVSPKVSLTISPFERANRLSILFKVLEKRSNLQNRHYPRKTNPKKKGSTPNINMNMFVLANLNVLVIRLILGLYSRYLSIINQAAMHPNPIKAS